MRCHVNRWIVLWLVTMALSLAIVGAYVRANLPPKPGVYWLGLYPGENPEQLRRRAEAAPEYQSALKTVQRQRRDVVLRASALWVVGGVALLGLGFAVNRLRQRRRA
jgi:hypothetical protein